MQFGPVPTQAVIPWGFGAASDAALPPFARLLAECGRFGFSRACVLVPSAVAVRVREFLSALPVIAQCAVPQVIAIDAVTAPAALCAGRAAFDPHVLLLDPASVLDANWLAIAPALATHDHALALTATGGPFELADGTVRSRQAPAGGLATAGVAIVRSDAFAANGACADLASLFATLVADGRVGGHVVPTQAVLPARADLPVRLPRPALFLDRDGTLNEDYGYVSDPERLVLLPGASAAVKRANDLGWYVFLVTNQSGVGRGYYDEAQVLLCNAALQDQLRAAGAHLDDIRYAPDHPDAEVARYRSTSDWRKPGPGMLIDLMAHWPVQRDESLMVGDKESDLDAGRAAGVARLLFEGGDLDAFLAPHVVLAPHFTQDG